MINEVRENGVTSVKVVVTKVEEKIGKNDKAYTSVTFSDGHSTSTSNVFRPFSEWVDRQGKVMDMNLTIKNGFMTILSATEDPSGNPSDFCEHAPINVDQAVNFIRKVIQNMQDTDLKTITSALFEENLDRFIVAPAAKSVHQNCMNGLLHHTTYMLSMAQYVVKIYELDKDLLFAGVILHDMGKIEELPIDMLGGITYSSNGNLFGHLFLGTQMVIDKCRALGIPTTNEKVKMLLHMILSHHGKKEYGAVEEPAFAEAYALYNIDTLDARMWMYGKETEKLEPGKCGTPNIFLDNAAVYRREC